MNECASERVGEFASEQVRVSKSELASELASQSNLFSIQWYSFVLIHAGITPELIS